MVRLRIIEGDHLLKVGPGRGVFSTTEQDKSQVPVTQSHQQGILGLLGQAECLFGHLKRLLMFGLDIMKHRQLTQNLAELRYLPGLLAQFAGPDIGFFHFRDCTAGGYPGPAKGELQSKLLLSVFGKGWQFLEHCQPSGQVSESLLVSVQLHGFFPGLV